MYEALTTKDGSLTYRNTKLDVTYRSLNGAEFESRYVFLEGTGIDQKPDSWRILELGFGTGLNFAVASKAATQAGVRLEYVSLEPHPMPSELWLVDKSWKSLQFDQATTKDKMTLTILNMTWQDSELQENHFDACYHDPFGPGQAPECWSAECFLWSYRALNEQGVLATFGASSAARRAMKEVGFLVGSLPGAPGKREMTVASKSAAAIERARPWKRNT